MIKIFESWQILNVNFFYKISKTTKKFKIKLKMYFDVFFFEKICLSSWIFKYLLKLRKEHMCSPVPIPFIWKSLSITRKFQSKKNCRFLWKNSNKLSRFLPRKVSVISMCRLWKTFIIRNAFLRKKMILNFTQLYKTEEKKR